MVARRLGRNSIGYEIDLELKPIIEERLVKRIPITNYLGEEDKIEFIVRDDARKLRTRLREEIEKKLTKSKK